MIKSKYSEKLLDPRWQKKRLEIFQRDEFMCQFCKSETKTLCVHHKYYIKGHEPWNYPDEVLITLCSECHQEETEIRQEIEEGLIQALRVMNFKWKEILILSQAVLSRDFPTFEDLVSTYREMLHGYTDGDKD